MKYLVYLLILFGTWDRPVNNYQQKPDLLILMDLLGSWERVDGRPGTTSFEVWEKISNNEFKGIGVTMKESDTVFVEKLKLITENDKIFYVAEVSHNAAPVKFALESSDLNKFVFSNPNHDFPKVITYEIMDKKIKVTISGDGKSAVFNFVKKG